MKYSFGSLAGDEINEAVAFYRARAGAAVALDFLAELERAAVLVAASPGLGKWTLGGRQIFPLRGFPNSLIYRDAGSEVRIIAVAHQRRRPGYWRRR
ncbi:MAG: type II toxin-antitoxin system RelE/ParE family toxin [Xanthomonadales bacterium]|nr:type II toxin-antitoxin system RelE/ParE family toxin [Xanthomonadales bacterium]